MATTKALELGQFGTDLTVDDSTGAVTIANDITVNAATSTGIDDNATTTKLTISDTAISATTANFRLTGGYNFEWGSGFTNGDPAIWANTSQKKIRIGPSGNTDGEILVVGTYGIDVNGDVKTTGTLKGPSLFYIDPSTYETDSDGSSAGSAAGTVRIRGDLIVDGATTTINSTTLTVDDLNIVLASGAADSATADGAGITIDGASATLTYSSTDDKFVFNKALDANYTRVISSGAATSPTDGTSLEIHYVTSGRTQGEGAYLIPYDRDNSQYKPLTVDAQTIRLVGGNTLIADNLRTDAFVPSQRLHVYDPSTAYILAETGGTGTSAGHRSTAGTNDWVWFATEGQPNYRLYDYSASAVRLTVKNNGNVGIGTEDPQSHIEIEQTGSTVFDDTDTSGQAGDGATLAIQNLSDTNDTFSQILFRNRNASKAVSRIVSITNGTGTDLAFVVENQGSAPSEVMRIVKSGNIGIGTTDPVDNYAPDVTGGATKLAVVGATTGSGWHETAHFVAGSDDDNTGAVVRIGHYDNDRGLAIKAGRQVSNRSIAHFELRSSNNADYPILTLKEETANGAQLYVGINNNDPSTNLHIVDEADGGASWNTFQQIGRRAGSGDNLHFQTLHDGSDGVNAMAIVIGSARKLEVDKRDTSYAVGAFNDGGQSGEGKALRVVASGRGVGIPDVNVLQVENNADTLFGVQNNGALKGKNLLPTTKPALLLDFANSSMMDPRMTFVRASKASYTDEDGRVKIVDYNQPRFDHHKKTGERLGLLLEPSRTNELPNISSGEWDESGGASIIENTTETLSPAGDYTAAKVIRGTDAAYQTIGFTTATVSSGYVWVTWYGKNNPDNPGTWFIQWLDSTYSWQNTSFSASQLSGGSFETDEPYPGVDSTTKFSQYVGNGWYRLGVRLQTGGQAIGFTFHPFRADQVAGDGSTTYQYIWGVQLERGDFPTSYIPTQHEARTRNLDLAYMELSHEKDTAIYSEDGGTMLIDAFTGNTSNASGEVIVRFDDRTAIAASGTAGDNFINIDRYSSGLAARINSSAGGFTTNLAIGGNTATAQFNKIGLSYNGTRADYTYDGYQASNSGDSATTVPLENDIDHLWFGSDDEIRTIRKFAYWRKYHDIYTLHALTED